MPEHWVIYQGAGRLVCACGALIEATAHPTLAHALAAHVRTARAKPDLERAGVIERGQEP